MYTIEHLRHLFAYNDWANRRIITALKENKSERARQILAHSLITEKEYFERLYGKDSTGFDFWQDLTIEECGDLARETADDYEKLLRKFEEEGLGIIARYRTSEGIPHENTFRELFSHVLLHSATHRGNIMLKLREEGFTPPKIDYIIYLRETKYI
ncbi:MAG: DinB family protein [Pyrinomonadaceae bacterium]